LPAQKNAIKKKKKPKMPIQTIILYASVSSDPRFKTDTDSLTQLFESKGIPYVMVDGASPEIKDLRSILFNCSNKRGIYPQIFSRHLPNGKSPKLLTVPDTEEKFTFVGTWEFISEANENNSVSRDFDRLFTEIERCKPGRALIGTITAGTVVSAPLHPDDAEIVNEPLAKAVVNLFQSVAQESVSTIDTNNQSLPTPIENQNIHSTNSNTSTSTLTLTPWEQRISKEGETFWFNIHTKAVSWVDPRNAIPSSSGGEAVWIPMVNETNETYYYNWQTGLTSWTI
jgi:hypothetical protein